VQGRNQPQNGNSSGETSRRARNQRRPGSRQGNNPPSDSDNGKYHFEQLMSRLTFFIQDGDQGPPPAGGAVASSTSRASIIAPRTQNARNNTDNSSTSCHCQVPAVERVSSKESTLGRKFFTCGTDAKCGFFQWKENLPSRPVVSTDAPSQNRFGNADSFRTASQTVPSKRKVRPLFINLLSKSLNNDN
jgi:hypothetical protein